MCCMLFVFLSGVSSLYGVYLLFVVVFACLHYAVSCLCVDYCSVLLLFGVWFLLCVRCLLFGVCLLCVVCCLFVVRCLLFGACLLLVVSCVLAVCYLSCACCLLFALCVV